MQFFWEQKSEAFVVKTWMPNLPNSFLSFRNELHRERKFCSTRPHLFTISGNAAFHPYIKKESRYQKLRTKKNNMQLLPRTLCYPTYLNQGLFRCCIFGCSIVQNKIKSFYLN